MTDFLKSLNGNADLARSLAAESRVRDLQQKYAQEKTGAAAEQQPKNAEIPPEKLEEIEKAAIQFEGLLVQQLLKSMWTTVPKGGLLSGSSEESHYRDMLNESLAEQISTEQSIGVKDVVMRELMARYKPGG